MIQRLFILAVMLTSIIGCSNDDRGVGIDSPDEASNPTELYGTWITDLGPTGHDGFSHSTFNSDGSFELDMAFIVAGSDCYLDVTTIGTYVADPTTVTITHVSGTQRVSQCSDSSHTHDERSLTADELDSYNATGQMSWSITDEVLTLSDSADLNRTYTRNTAAVLYDTWVTDLGPLGHEGFSHSTFYSDGSYELDMAFVVAGSDCHLDVSAVGIYEASATTLTITHVSGTQRVSQCSDISYTHEERPLTGAELNNYNAAGQMSWSITDEVLTLSDGADLNRTYTRNPAAKLYDTWVTDLIPLGHDGFSHSTFNSDGSYQMDMAFVVAGSDCHLDVTTVGTYVANSTTLTITHMSGTQAISQCSDSSHLHDERPLTAAEIDNFNATGELNWSITAGTLTLTDGGDLNRTYTRNPPAVLYDTWVTDLSPLGHEGFSHSTFNSDGTYEMDMAFVVAGSDCHLDVTTVGHYMASSTTLTITHMSGTQAVSQCSDNSYIYDERPLTAAELESYNAAGELNWSITSGVLTLTDGGELHRTYTRNPAAVLYDTWVTDLGPLGHVGFSHSTFNSDGSYQLDMAFVVAGSDCHLDVTTAGTYVADSTTLTITHVSGTQAVSQCADESYIYDERALTAAELDGYNATGELNWSLTSGTLTLSDGAELNRTYTRNSAAVLYDTWATDLGPIGHDGFSHSTFNSDGSYELDMEFIVAGSDCHLDVTVVGMYEVSSTTLTVTHASGTQAVSQCSDDNYNHEERPLTEAELDSYNATGQLNWSITAGVLTLTDGDELNRTYTRNRAAVLYDKWVTDLSPLGHEGYSHSTFNANGSYELDMEFVVAGSDCHLDVMVVGTYLVSSTTLTVTHASGTQAVSQCSVDTHNHEERPLTEDELASFNATGELSWSITSGVLTLTDGGDLVRTYTRYR